MSGGLSFEPEAKAADAYSRAIWRRWIFHRDHEDSGAIKYLIRQLLLQCLTQVR